MLERKDSKRRNPDKKLCEDFRDKYAGTRVCTTLRDALKADDSKWKRYSYVIAGSDQIWNMTTGNRAEIYDYYYLQFIERSKRIAYAPSFGFSEMPGQEDLPFIKRGLLGFDKLSCREQDGCDLIRQITGQEAQCVLDPTLLLDSEQWKELESRPKYNLPEKYVLCYFLGSRTSEYKQAIKEAAMNLPVIDFDHNNEEFHKYTGPAEFLYLISHADFVCTDSFHGVAFSINFGKNFLVFRRIRVDGTSAGMWGRIESITANTGITDHIYETGIKIRPDDIDYEAVNQKLSVMRESSMKYLRECLKIQGVI